MSIELDSQIKSRQIRSMMYAIAQTKDQSRIIEYNEQLSQLRREKFQLELSKQIDQKTRQRTTPQR